MRDLGFQWVLPGRLAGAARPGLWTPLERDMALFAELGIRLVVTLTEDPLDPSPEVYGFRSLHLPIPDMGAPDPAAALAVCREIALSISRGEPAVLHCKAGLGRTGTLLACTLVALGHTAEQAISAVRRVCPLYIQSDAQEDFVARFATFDREGDARKGRGGE